MSELTTISGSDSVGDTGADTADRSVGSLRQATAAPVGLGNGPIVVSLASGEAILRQAEREIDILVASENVTITHARYAAGQRIAGPHIHHRHTDAFYVLEGELAFEVGHEAERVRISAGGLVVAPPGLAHSVRTVGDGAARWLTIHAHDGGFAAFMRGIRDGIEVEWDIALVPANGGLSASEAIITRRTADLPIIPAGSPVNRLETTAASEPM
jgi:mannose-6-phosphate isomerase-like protein (cupin superfamily)